ncbi:MAG: cytochrome c oxidase assembly protein [Alphaproteobacteria bacterium]|nr:MAG: cytochrome c oxidase assembly protein [Alphaproteobacteria bacterium]
MADLREKNRKVMTATLGVVAGMIALSFASVPLYRLTCKVTGWGGTTQTASSAEKRTVLDREITVRFNADTAQDLPWNFKPEQGPVKVKIGADRLVSFSAENVAGSAVAGTAVYNVTPLEAGRYFFKTQCFCFSQQVLKPHEKVHMPVAFYIDPKITEDPDLGDLKTITLSYTFYRAQSTALEQATEKFYNTHGDKPSKVN